LRRLRRFLHPRRLQRRPWRQMLQPRDLVLQRLVLALQPSRFPLQRFIRRPKPPHLAEQIANQADQFGRSHPFKRITRARRHPQLESYFQAVGTPPPPENLPWLLWIARNPLKSPESDEGIQENPSPFSWS